LIDQIAQRISNEGAVDSVLFRQRHHESVMALLKLLNEAQQAVIGGRDVEITAAILFEARTQIDFLLGRSDIENVLGKIFSSFCIGK